jgi:site-specific recombinase XerD
VNDSLREIVQEEFDSVVTRKMRDLIFLNKNKDKAISISYVNRQLKSAFEKYGVKAGQISSHLFRKSFAYKVLEDNDFSEKGIFLVSRLLNHANISTTMVYLQLDVREEENAYQNLGL